MSLIVAARSSGENGPLGGAGGGRTHGGGTAPGSCARWRGGATSVLRHFLAGDKVLLVSTMEASGRRRAGSRGRSSPERGCRQGGGTVAESDDVRWWRGGSGGRQRGSRGHVARGERGSEKGRDQSKRTNARGGAYR
jgi:hypothetical protein